MGRLPEAVKNDDFGARTTSAWCEKLNKSPGTVGAEECEWPA